MKRLLASIVFVSLLVFGLFYASAVVRPNEDRDGIWHTYKSLEPNSLDVLLTGSSKIHANINPLVMWKQCGFTSYDISGSSMDFATMYYYLREAFKTQHPKVVVIDILLMGDNGTTLNDIQMRNIMNMPLDSNKLYASLGKNVPATEREKVLFPFEQYHSRVLRSGEVTSTNYLDKTFEQESSNVFMGYRYLDASQKIEPINDVQAYDVALFDRHYAELKRSLDFLKRQNCQVLLVNTPSDRLNYLSKYENELNKRISSQYENVSFCWPQMYKQRFVIDYQSEMLDNTHLNAKGSERFSAFFGRYLKSRYRAELDKSVSKPKTLNMFQTDYDRYCQYKIEQGQGQ